MCKHALCEFSMALIALAGNAEIFLHCVSQFGLVKTQLCTGSRLDPFLQFRQSTPVSGLFHVQTRTWFVGGPIGGSASAGIAAAQLPWVKPPRKAEPVPGKPRDWVPFPRVPFPVSKEPILSPKDKALEAAAQVRACCSCIPAECRCKHCVERA